MGELLKLLKNTRVAAAIGAVVCGTIAVGAYTPTADVEAALTTFVALGAGGAMGALVSYAASRWGGK